MRKLKWRLIVPIVALFISLIPTLVVAQVPEEFNHPLFEDTWLAYDQAVIDGTSDISWTWGPAYRPATAVSREVYSNSPGGVRTVQYFDKSRMEDNSYRASGQWAVANGLLVVELVTGRMQVGDFEFVQCAPSEHPVAGDPDQEGSDVLTYADLADGFAPNAYEWDPVFSDFLAQHNELYTIGYASTAPKTITAMVDGTPREVIVQAGERRVLTYTEGNPVTYLSEWGNVGQHYYDWRYGDNGCDGGGETPIPPPPADDVPVTHAVGFDITGRCDTFMSVGGHDVCAIPAGVSGDVRYEDNSVVFTHNRQPIGDAAMVLRIQANPGGAEAVQISGNDRMKVWFQTSLDGDLTCAEEGDCRADDSGRVVVTIPEDGEIILYVGSIGPVGYEVTYTFGHLDDLEGNVISSARYVWTE